MNAHLNMFAFGLMTVCKENIFKIWIEHHCQVPHLLKIHDTILATILFFSLIKKMNIDSSGLKHPREKLPQPAVSVLDTTPEVNFQCGRFFITQQGFDSRVNFIVFRLWRVDIFHKFFEIILIL